MSQLQDPINKAIGPSINNEGGSMDAKMELILAKADLVLQTVRMARVENHEYCRTIIIHLWVAAFSLLIVVVGAFALRR